MTTQAGVSFHYEGTDYSLIAYTGSELPTNHDFGISVSEGENTGIWRGYTMTFGIFENQLVVKDLKIVRWITESIDGIRPIKRDGLNMYENVNHSFQFTGHLIFGNVTASIITPVNDEQFIERHGLPIMLEVTVVNRRLVEVTDWSKQLLERWKKYPTLDRLAERGKIVRQLEVGSQEHTQAFWDLLTEFLPRRYDNIRTPLSSGLYRNFRYEINRFKRIV